MTKHAFLNGAVGPKGQILLSFKKSNSISTIKSTPSGMPVLSQHNPRQEKVNPQTHFTVPRKQTRRKRHLTDSQIEKFRSRLWAKCGEILNTVSGVNSEISMAENTSVGPKDEADMASLENIILEDYQLLESERCILKDIDESLERIQKGTYGLCQECTKQIAKRRLRAIPWAQYCVHCATGVESPTRCGCHLKAKM